ncbi:MAG: peptidase metallopeptidase [Devosia sp.]|nr:peptidase metallopeptidase [Devosia sp.]
MANMTPQEQLMLELINRARMDPAAEAARLGTALGTVTATPKQILAGNESLAQSSENHSEYMHLNDEYSYNESNPDGLGFTGFSVGVRASAAGYPTPSGTTIDESVSRVVTGSSSSELTAAIVAQYNAFFANAADRGRLLNNTFRELGVGQEYGQYQGFGNAFVTNDYANSGNSNVFITGIIYNDSIPNDFFNVGEELIGRDVAGSGGVSDSTGGGGGYELGFATTNQLKQINLEAGAGTVSVSVALGTQNVKLDLIDRGTSREIWTNGSVTLLTTNVVELHALGISSLTLTGSSIANSIFGNSGSNTLNGAAGNDTLVGGLGADALNGGADFDYASYITATTGITARLDTPGSNTGAAAGDTYNSVEGLQGSNFADLLVGDDAVNGLFGAAGGDRLFGLAGGDTINGEAGDDTLNGGAGGDALNGGADFDYASYSLATAAVRAQLSAPAGNTGEAAGDTYVSIEGLQGSNYSDALVGNDAVNGLFGGAGNDSLSALGGADTLRGEAGNDTLIGGSGADIIDGGANFDYASYINATSAVRASLTSPASNTGDAAGDTYIAIEGLEGSNYADLLTGNSGNNSIYAGAGSDRIIGLGGQDSLYGRAGNDVFQFNSAADSAVGGTRDVIYDFDDFDNDTIDLSVFAGTLNYIGSSNFGEANQIRAVQSGADVLIQINTDASLSANSEILLANTTLNQIDAGDFIV